MAKDYPYDQLVKVYRKIRTARSELAKDFKTKDDELKAQLAKVGNAILAKLNCDNTKSVNTDAGIAYWQDKIIPRADDWEAFYAWVAETGAFDALEKRIKSTFVTEYMEANEGKLPPGVSILSEREVRVRDNNQ